MSSGVAMIALRSGRASGNIGELGVLLAGARVSEGEEMSERADGRVVVVLKPSLTRLMGPAPVYGR